MKKWLRTMTALLCTAVLLTGLTPRPQAWMQGQGGTIDYVVLTDLHPPEVGQPVDERWSTPYADGCYYVEAADWETAEGVVASWDRVRFDTTYEHWFSICTETGYRFSDKVTVDMDGYTYYAYAEDSNSRIYAIRPYTTPKERYPISCVELYDVHAPAAGQAPDYGLTLGQPNFYSVVSNQWVDGQTGKLLDWYDTFEEGREYSRRISIQTGEDYYFTDNAVALFGNEYIEAYQDGDLLWAEKNYTIPDSRKKIDGVSLMPYSEPKTGEYPNTKIDLYGDVELTNVCWQTKDGTVLAADERFAPGREYFLVVTMRPKSGYRFPDSLTVDFGTKESQVAYTPVNGEIVAFSSYTTEELPPESTGPEIITDLQITELDAPAAGAYPDYEYTVRTAGVQANGCAWRDLDTLAYLSGEPFQAGHRYMCQLFLYPDKGYTFAGLVTGTVSGREASGRSLYDQLTMSVEYSIPAEKPAATPAPTPAESGAAADTIIRRIDITDVTEPVAGAHPADTEKLPEDSGCQIIDRVWTEEGGAVLEAGDVFTADRPCTRTLELKAKPGYRFASGLRIYFDGQVSYEADHGETILVSRDYVPQQEQHQHVCVAIRGTPPTEAAPGTKTYYLCSCGKCFEDAEGTMEITEDLNTWKVIPQLTAAQSSSEHKIWRRHSGSPLCYNAHMALSALKAVSIDDQALGSGGYAMDEKTGEVLLLAAALEELAVGEHTAVFTYEGGEYAESFTVIDTAAPAGPGAMTVLPWVLLAAVLAGVVVAVIVMKGKKR